MVASTTRWGTPVLHTEARSAGLIVRTPTRIRRPASAGMAMLSTGPPKATMIMAITTPAITSEARLRAPAVLLSDDADTDPPTGIP